MKYLNIIWFIVISALISSCSLMRNTIYKPFYYKPKVKYDFNTTIPYEIENGLIILKISVNGEVCKVIFDTASKSYLKRNIVEKLNLFSCYTSTSKDANGIEINSDVVQSNIKIGGLQLNEFNFSVRDTFPFDCHGDIDGILGNDILNQGVFYFDNSNQLLTISNSLNSELDLTNFNAINIKVNIGNLIIKNKGIKYTLDSGFQNGFILTNLKSGLYDKKIDSKEITQLFQMLNSYKVSNLIIQNSKIKINKTDYSGFIQYSEELNLNLLGSTWFKENTIIIDVNNKKIYFEKGESITSNNLSNIKNVHFSFIDNEVYVSGISKSITEIDLLDKVYRINDIDLDSIKNNCSLSSLISSLDLKTGMKLELQSQNESEKKIIFLSHNDLYN